MKKFWNGVLAFGPAGLLAGSLGGLMFALVALFLMSMYSVITGNDLSEVSNILVGVLAIIAMFSFYGCAFLAVFLCIADIIVFSIYAYRNPKLDTTMKTLWCCAFISVQFMAFPVYWWMYIRKG